MKSSCSIQPKLLHKHARSPYIIQTVSRALDLLEQLRHEENELGVTELSRRMNLHKNNVFRLLVTLESRNYVEQNQSTGNYYLGFKNLELGQSLLRQSGLLRQSRSTLEALTAQSGETSYVAVLRDFRSVYLDSVESSLPLRVVPRLGSTFPAHCTATGKVQIAEHSSDQLAAVYASARIERHTTRTCTDPETLLGELRQIALQGYAIEDEELYDGVRCVAAPIHDYTRMIIGAISISGPAVRLTDQRLTDELIPLVIKSAAELSVKLGFRHQ